MRLPPTIAGMMQCIAHEMLYCMNLTSTSTLDKAEMQQKFCSKTECQNLLLEFVNPIINGFESRIQSPQTFVV